MLREKRSWALSCRYCKVRINKQKFIERIVEQEKLLMSNESLYSAAKEAINRLFADTSVPKSTTRMNLESPIAEIDIWTLSGTTTMPDQTPFIESNILLAVIRGDYEHAREQAALLSKIEAEWLIAYAQEMIKVLTEEMKK
jgi:hypothetical protein